MNTPLKIALGALALGGVYVLLTRKPAALAQGTPTVPATTPGMPMPVPTPAPPAAPVMHVTTTTQASIYRGPSADAGVILSIPPGLRAAVTNTIVNGFREATSPKGWLRLDEISAPTLG